MASERITLKRRAARARIIKVALKAFTELGYEKATTVQIADALGMTGPALYHYFPTKDALLFACIESVMSMLADALAEAAAVDGSPLDRLAAIVQTQVIHELKVAAAGPVVNAHLYGPSFLTDVIPETERNKLRALQRRVLDVYRTQIRAAIADGSIPDADVTLATFNILAMVQYTVVWFKRGGKYRMAEVALAQSRALLRMLGAAPREQP